MKRYLSFILIAFLTISLTSCATYTTINSNKWLEYELPPSRIVQNGQVFFEGKLSDGSMFSVFTDDKIQEDARYYHIMLWQDFGWTLKDDKTWVSPPSARHRKLGHIYINPSRGAAVYYHPDREYSVFKVTITK
ncbi:hypothetical protein [Pedobacter frigiditerrae]|uniref:hypothetical protein n=1 Tax=Pedobacter frigiditerrae TaxID=2530452 RepID=UPI00292E571D|nr:hypothetical protein [Pedobacter frigiditerrae]